MTDARKPLTRRRLILRLGAWSVALGVLVCAVGWWLWRPLLPLGIAMEVAGIAWLVTGPFCSQEVIRPQYLKRFWEILVAFAGYVLAMIVLGQARHAHWPLWVLVVLALLPAVLLAWAMVAEWRHVRQSDELEQRVQHQAMHMAASGTGVLAFAFGMLNQLGMLNVRGSLIFVLPVMFLLYAVAGWWFRRKYGLQGMC